MRPAEPSLITSAAIDAPPLIALQNLIFGPFNPEDLTLAEMALRALITVEDLHPVQFIEFELWPAFDRTDIIDDNEPPIGDSVLDYEFQWEPTTSSASRAAISVKLSGYHASIRRNALIHARVAARAEVIGVVSGHTGQSVGGPDARVGLLHPTTQPLDKKRER